MELGIFGIILVTCIYIMCTIKLTNKEREICMGVSVFEVARYFLSKSIPNTEYAITHLKLQKLVYYAQAWHVAITGEKLFNEKIEAWIHGPVCRELYNVYKIFGYSEIVVTTHVSEWSIPLESRKIIDDVWEAYGSLRGEYLEQLTHREDPWKQARIGLGDLELSNKEIEIETMRKYYSQFLNK